MFKIVIFPDPKIKCTMVFLDFAVSDIVIFREECFLLLRLPEGLSQFQPSRGNIRDALDADCFTIPRKEVKKYLRWKENPVGPEPELTYDGI